MNLYIALLWTALNENPNPQAVQDLHGIVVIIVNRDRITEKSVNRYSAEGDFILSKERLRKIYYKIST